MSMSSTKGGMTLADAKAMHESKEARIDLPRSEYGSLLFAPPSRADFCPKGKCLLKEEHTQACWPE